MRRLFWAGLLLFIVVGAGAAIQVRTRVSAARLGSDAIYTLDGQGDAVVKLVDKTYFVDRETERNFDGLVARMGRPDVEPFRRGVEKSLKELSDRTGHQIVVSDFEASFDRQPEYGAVVYRFRWASFATRRDGVWVVDFKAADPMRLNRDSSLTVVLPQGAALLRTEPAPARVDGGGTLLVWTGVGEVSWPYIEYR